MLSIFAKTEYLEKIQQIIKLEDRLDELVKIHETQDIASSGSHLFIGEKGIIIPINWQNTQPPYLLPTPLPFEQNILLGIIFNELGNSEKAWAYLNNNPQFLFEVGLINRLKYGYNIGADELSYLAKIQPENPFDNYRLLHNAAVIRHYGHIEVETNYSEVYTFYKHAINHAPNSDYQAFSTLHLSTLLLDLGNLAEAEALLESMAKNQISESAKYGLKAVLASVWMQRLTVPYDQGLVAKLKETIWETLQFFEKNGRKAEAGLMYLDAAHVANISESFSESLGYINKSVGFFEEEGLEELKGNAQLRKGTLMFTWAQNGNPQFYKPGVEAYQQALKVFRQDVTPDVFADIHHKLAVMYAEMPSESKKRSIWAGVSSASFQEALNYYTFEAHPYEYGMICNNFGNALIKFPAAIHSDNYQKALDYYREALRVRTVHYPYERAITLLNFLEASWNVSNSTDDFNKDRYNDMKQKAEEVKELVDDPHMLNEAQRHLDLLQKLVEKAVN